MDPKSLLCWAHSNSWFQSLNIKGYASHNSISDLHSLPNKYVLRWVCPQGTNPGLENIKNLEYMITHKMVTIRQSSEINTIMNCRI
jgi:hypothetical protein